MILARLTPHRLPVVLLAAVLSITVFLTGSRGGFLGAAVAVATLLAIMAWRRDLRRDLRAAIAQLRTRPILLLPVAAAGMVTVVAAPLVLNRFAQGGDSLRLDLWRSAMTIFAEHPLLGGGPGTWVQLKVEANPQGGANLILHHAHNLYVQAAAELGIVGIAALGVLAAAIAVRLGRGIRHPDLGPQAIAATAGLMAFLGQSLVDNFANLPYICLTIMLPLAWVDGGLLAAERDAGRRPGDPGANARRAQTRIGHRIETALLGGCLAALLVVTPTLARINDAAGAAGRGDGALVTQPEQALDAYSEALAIDPDFTLYRLERSGALARVGRLQEARSELEAVIRVDPVGINLISLASLDLMLQDEDAAREHISRALEQAPYELPVVLNAGLMAERLGDRELAVEQLAVAVALRPAIAALPLLSDETRLPPKSDIIARARSISAPEDAALILAYAGDPAAARAEIEARPASPTRDVLLAAIIWLGGDLDEAVERLEGMIRRNPLDYTAAGWLAGILQAEGDRRAGQYLRLVRLVQGDVGPAIAHSVTARVASASETPLGVPGYYPWAVYIRPFGPTVLAPGLTLIGSR
jgi:tetratricopeptide (TPR) repeat protein